MSESRKAVEEAAERLFRAHSTDLVARWAEAGEWPAPLWENFEGSGLAGIALSEARGGGGDWADALAVLRAAGRHFVPLPVAESVLGRWLLEQAGLPPVDGELALGPVLANTPLSLQQVDAGWRVSGEIDVAGRASGAQVLLALAQDGEGRCWLVRLEPRQAQIERRVDLAFQERSHLRLQAAGARSAGLLEGMTPQRFRAFGAATRVALMTGALERVLDLSVQYVQDRRQFGRPIGKFQAVQQQLAVLAGEVAASVMAFEALADSFGQPLFELEAAIAKARVSEAAGSGAAIAHQVHGAMGFTHEHALHLLTKRLWSWRDEYGNEREWHKVLGRFAARRGSAGLWNAITAETV